MNKIIDFLRSIYILPSARVLAIKELEDSKRKLLEMETIAEFSFSGNKIDGFLYARNRKETYLILQNKKLEQKTNLSIKKCPHCNEGTLEQYYYRFTLTRMLKNQFNVYTFLGCDKCNTYVNHGGICKELNVYDIGEKSTSVNEKEYKHLLNRYENSNYVVKFFDDFPQKRFSKDLTLAGIRKMINHDHFYSMVVNEIEFYRSSMKNCKLKHDFDCFAKLTLNILMLAFLTVFLSITYTYAEDITGYISNVLESIVFNSF